LAYDRASARLTGIAGGGAGFRVLFLDGRARGEIVAPFLEREKRDEYFLRQTTFAGQFHQMLRRAHVDGRNSHQVLPGGDSSSPMPGFLPNSRHLKPK